MIVNKASDIKAKARRFKDLRVSRPRPNFFGLKAKDYISDVYILQQFTESANLVQIFYYDLNLSTSIT